MNKINETTNNSNGKENPSVNDLSSRSSTKSLKTSLFGGSTIKKTQSTPSSHSDLIYLTTRLIGISFGRDQNVSMETIRNQLDQNHRSSYQIFSLDQNSSISTQTDRIVYLSLFNSKSAPTLFDLLNLCEKVFLYLLDSSNNVAVILSQDGKNSLALASCSLMAFGKVFPRVDEIVQFYEYRRCSPSTLTNSQKKYIQYLADLSFGLIERPHFKEIILQSINFSPIPIFNRQKNGCRPFVEIFTDDNKKIFSTYQDPSKLRTFLVTEQNSSIQLNCRVQGDLIIRLNHAPNGISFQATDGGIRICQLRFNSNFVTKKHHQIFYSKNEFECFDSIDRYSPTFQIGLETSHPDNESTKNDFTTSRLEHLEKTLQTSFLLFRDQNDSQKQIESFLKQMNPSKQENSFSSEIFRSQKSREDLLLSSSSTTSTSSNRQSQRYSGSSNPQSPSSFVNPFHNSLIHHVESKIPTIKSEMNIDESTIVSSPVDLNEISSDRESTKFERSISSDPRLNSFNSSSKSQNLLDIDDDNFIFITSSPSLILPTKIPISTSVETKPSNDAEKSTTTNKNDKNSIGQNLFDDLNIPIFDPISSREQFPMKKKPQTLVEIQPTKSTIDVDASVLKVRQWTEGKKRNIRALLCSLSSVTWPECGWKGCQMHELVTVDQVKKAYRKAVLYIHPDKLRDDPNETLAKLIFVELNEAWTQFDRENNR